MKNLNKLVFMFVTFMIAGTFTSTGYSQDESGSNLQIEEKLNCSYHNDKTATRLPSMIVKLLGTILDAQSLTRETQEPPRGCQNGPPM